LFAGVDEDGTPRLFETDPTGIFFQYKATAIGEGETEVEEILHKKYTDSITVEDGLVLATQSLKKALGEGFNEERLDGAYISIKDKTFTRLTKSDFQRILKK
jgi:proteasome alpha subunit